MMLSSPGGHQRMTKQQFLSTMLSAFQKFEYTHSPELLRTYIKKTRQDLSQQISQLQYSQQDCLSVGQDRISQDHQPVGSETAALRRQKQLNQQLEREYAQELEIAKGGNIRQSQVRFNGRVQEMEETLFVMKKQLDRVNEDIRGFMANCERNRFFKEWQLMYSEYVGAKSLSTRLKKELVAKNQEIKRLKQG